MSDSDFRTLPLTEWARLTAERYAARSELAMLRADLAIEREAIAPIYAERDRLRALCREIEDAPKLPGIDGCVLVPVSRDWFTRLDAALAKEPQP